MSWLREKAWPGCAGEEQQQVELALGELRLLAADERAPAAGVDREAVEAQRRRLLRRGVDPAQHGVDAGHELGRRERLDDVVVGAEPQADHPVGLLALGGQQDHRDPRSRPESRMRRITSRPSMPGSIRSSTTRSGRCAFAISIAPGPSPATRVS